MKRNNPTDPIYIHLRLWNPETQDQMAEVLGLFDTGNDHTTISQELFDALKLKPTGRPMTIKGVTGSAGGGSAHIGIGVQMDGTDRGIIDKHEVAVLAGLSDQVLIGRDFLAMFDVTIKRDGTVLIDR